MKLLALMAGALYMLLQYGVLVGAVLHTLKALMT
jgi:hypothetical protein